MVLGDADDDMMGAEHVQTLTFAPDADVFNYAACAHPEARLILLANLRAQTVYAVHLAEKGAGFDYVSEYSVTMPVLSFTAVRETDPEAPADPARGDAAAVLHADAGDSAVRARGGSMPTGGERRGRVVRVVHQRGG